MVVMFSILSSLHWKKRVYISNTAAWKKLKQKFNTLYIASMHNSCLWNLHNINNSLPTYIFVCLPFYTVLC